VQNINLLRALEGELARTIASLAPVSAARVHLVMPTREPFSRDREEPSASIMLRLNAGGLSPNQVMAIQHLVAAAVPRLQPEHVAVVDGSGKLLSGDNEGGDAANARGAEQMRQAFEDRLGEEVVALLERTVGPGKVIADVAADIDFDRVTTQSERYDPDGQVVRSTALEEEEETQQERGAENTVSVANNIPNAPDQAAGDVQAATRSTATRETTNYEISRVVETHVREGGVIKRLSVAVLVDGVYDGDGNYTPRAAEELEKYVQLVRSSIGFREDRGDEVQVVNLQFAPAEALEGEFVEPGFLGFDKYDLIRMAEMLVLGVVAVLAILLVVRPLIGRLLEAIPPAAPGSPAPATDRLLPNNAAGAGMNQLAPPPGAAGGAASMPRAPSQLEEMIDISQVDGQVRASSMKRITEIVERHPDETVSILRNWMVQSS
jgi:flagellar M-ring protein FliF